MPVAKKKLTDQTVKHGEHKYFIALTIILLLSFIVYLPTLHNGFVNRDDDKYVQNNPLIQSINLKAIFSSYVMGNYHPLTMLSYAIEYHFFGLNATAYHAVNLFIHLFNVILVFYAVLLLSNKTRVALITSLLFGIHPMHVESVAWISELKDLLYTFFFLASYICYMKYLKLNANHKEKPIFNMSASYFNRYSYLVFSLLLFLFSLLSKAMAASLPLLLLLTDYFKERKLNTKAWLEKVPFFALSFVFGSVAVLAQKSLNALDVIVFPLLQRIVFVCYGFICYLFKILLPVKLCAYYPYPVEAGSDVPVQYYSYLLLVIALAVYIIYSVRFSKKILFGMGFFTITIFLVLQFLPVGAAIIADRYSYLSSIGIFYLAGEVFLGISTPGPSTKKKLRLGVIVLFYAVTIFFSARTFDRCHVWKDGFTLWSDVIREYDDVPVAFNNRGNFLLSLKRYDEAILDYSRAIVLDPSYSEAYNGRAVLLMKEKKEGDALKDFDKAIELKPDDYLLYYNRGSIFAHQNKYEAAISDYNKAIALNPQYAEAYSNRGNVLMKQEKYDEALKDYSKALELQPRLAEVYFNKAVLEYKTGQRDDACKDLQKATALGLQQATVFYNQVCH